jgi:methionine-rich copper-binding protein CopC
VNKPHRRNNLSHHSYVLIFLLCTFLASQSTAQHGEHGGSSSGHEHVISVPDNDEVLASAPESIMLHFESPVRLVKLVLKEPSQGKEPINIGFSYHPSSGVHYLQALPKLQSANYYRVEWAAFDNSDTLIKGTFHFSFGQGANPPSSFLNQMDHPNSILSPDYRLQ